MPDMYSTYQLNKQDQADHTRHAAIDKPLRKIPKKREFVVSAAAEGTRLLQIPTLKYQIPENRHFAGLRVNTAIAQIIDTPHLISAPFIQTAGTQVVVLGLEHDTGQILLAAPELDYLQQ